VDLSWYHLLTGLLVLLRQTTPSGKHVRVRAAHTISDTPPEPCDDVNTANLSRYGIQYGESAVPEAWGGAGTAINDEGVSQVQMAPPS
jgi:hypothetical protein